MYNNDKPKIDLNIGLESTDEELKEVENLFSDSFNVKVSKGYVRLADGILPFLIYIVLKDIPIGIITSLFCDLLKQKINEFITNKNIKIKRKKMVEMMHKTPNGEFHYIISEELFIRTNRPENIIFDNIDSLFIDINNRNKDE